MIGRKRSLLDKLVLVLICCLFPTLFLGGINGVDFSAFYCGGESLRLHTDPNAANVLGACEHTVLQSLYATNVHHMPFTAPLNMVFPAPFPAYALGFFSLFAYFSPVVAYGLWFALQILSLCLIITVVRALTKLPTAFIFCGSAITLCLLPLKTGQLSPIIFAAFLLVIWWNERGAYRRAASAALFTCIEPHLGLPICLGLFLVEARSRLMLVCGGALLAIISLLVMPMHQIFEYAHVILPEHAIAEASHDGQYSLTHWLSSFGVNSTIAAKLGSLQYVLMLVLGSSIVIMLKKRQVEKRMLLLCLPTFATFGGAFIHIAQMFTFNLSIFFLIAKFREKQKDENFPQMIGLALALMALELPLDSLGIQPFIWCYGLFALVIASYGSGFPNRRGLFAACGYFLATFAATNISEGLLRKSPPYETGAALITAAQRHSNDAEYIWRVISQAYLSWRGETSLLLQAPALIAAAYVLWLLADLQKKSESS